MKKLFVVVVLFLQIMQFRYCAIIDKRLYSNNLIAKITDDFDSNNEINILLNNDTFLHKDQEKSSILTGVELLGENVKKTQTLSNVVPEKPVICNLSSSLINEIKGYKTIANKILSTILNGSFKARTYNDLAYFVDRFGSRVAGSKNLEKSIDYMLDKMTQDGLDNVHGEVVPIPHWVRGEESAEMILPRRKKLALLGLGYSVGTPLEGITAEVLVVKSFEDLKKKANKAKGKIIVYNEAYNGYGESVVYRGKGASMAAKYGGVASLIRSITPFSINSPHTGMQTYQPNNITKIPTACITIEDAELLNRLQDQGEKITIQLKMNDTNLSYVKSRNAIAEITGREKPDEIVVVSGHIDSWDVGQGAMDDGGGMIIAAEAVALLKFLNLQPRRTLRAILWTTEEFGLIGVQEYIKQHENELNKFTTVFESDIGTFRPRGLDFSGTDEAGCIIQEVLKLLSPINATTYRKLPEVGSDIGYFIEKGIPGVSLNTDNDRYFYYHHSEGDTMTVENSDELDLCTAVWTISSYVIADLSVSLPKR